VTLVERFMFGKDELVVMKTGDKLMRGYLPDGTLRAEAESDETFRVNLNDKGVFLFDEETGERYV